MHSKLRKRVLRQLPRGAWNSKAIIEVSGINRRISRVASLCQPNSLLMYDIDLDLVLHFVPPMDDKGPGIRLNRTFQLPFPPSTDVFIFSKEWEGFEEEPLGYHLKEITWDADRSCFLAQTFICHHGDPIAIIPHELRQLLKCGWRFGSYVDKYVGKDRRGRERKKLKLPRRVRRWNADEAESWELAGCKSRPADFMVVWHAVIAMMAALDNNCAVAYAMLRTGFFLETPENKPLSALSQEEQVFKSAVVTFQSWSLEEQWNWRDRVKRKYPRLIDVVEALA